MYVYIYGLSVVCNSQASSVLRTLYSDLPNPAQTEPVCLPSRVVQCNTELDLGGPISKQL